MPLFCGWPLKIGFHVPTGDRLLQWGDHGDVVYFIEITLNTRIIFSLSVVFSSRIWKAFMTKFLIDNPVIEWDRLVAWSLQNLRGKDISAVICRLVYGSSFL